MVGTFLDIRGDFARKRQVENFLTLLVSKTENHWLKILLFAYPASDKFLNPRIVLTGGIRFGELLAFYPLDTCLFFGLEQSPNLMRSEFADYLSASIVTGSRKASSYLRALDLLCEMIRIEPCGFADCQNIWSQDSIERLEELNAFVLDQQRLGDKSVWNLTEIAPSYLTKGFTSAALRDYQRFLAEFRYRDSLIKAFESHSGDEESVVKRFDIPFEYPSCLIDGLTEKEGKEVVREVKTRTNQNAFQSIVMKNFRGMCCITNLDVSEANRASHIIPWSARKDTRMDPRNGLYLSATYDAVFDRSLLSLDEDYRVILSRDLKDRYTSSSYAAYFGSKEGMKISLPVAYLPKQEYLEFHRERGRF